MYIINVSLQMSIQDFEQQMVTVFVDGVEDYCQCGFSRSSVSYIFPQCFPDNSNKISVIILVQTTPSRNISEIIFSIWQWIENGTLITIADNLLHIDSNCNIEIIQGPNCGTTTPSPSSCISK